MAFVKGQSGNPKGRPRGAKDKLASDFVGALASDFAEHGASVIAEVRASDPAKYLTIVAGVVPKELVFRDERGVVDLPDDELAHIATGGGAGAASAQGSPQESDAVH